MVSFMVGETAPGVLISQGSAGHAYVFAELAYKLSRRGFNVLIMPRHGGVVIDELVERQRDALRWIRSRAQAPVGVFAEGLGALATFYLSLTDDPKMDSAVYMNGPAVLTERTYLESITHGSWQAVRRRLLMPWLPRLAQLMPQLPIPISVYLDFDALRDTAEKSRALERHLVHDGYLKDPDFDRVYPLKAVVSLISTPPPAPPSSSRVPTYLMAPVRGPLSLEYCRSLFERLPRSLNKKFAEVDGSAFWMLSHPGEAAGMIADWFDLTLSRTADPDALGVQESVSLRSSRNQPQHLL